MVIKEFNKYPPLYHFADREMKQTVAVGEIKKFTRKPEKDLVGEKSPRVGPRRNDHDIFL